MYQQTTLRAHKAKKSYFYEPKKVRIWLSWTMDSQMVLDWIILKHLKFV